jgi:hypothetical protein
LILYRFSIRELDVVNDQYQKLEFPDAFPRLLVGLHQYEYYRQGGVSGFRSLGFLVRRRTVTEADSIGWWRI